MKKVLIINGHPDSESFCTALAANYAKGAEKAGATTTTLHLSDQLFSPVLAFGYRKRTELEPYLKEAQQLISEASHLVFIYPTWWGTFPALLKGFLDRVFLPGFAFKYRENSLFWDKLLTQKTARIITTMDTPSWYYKLVYRNAGIYSFQKNVLEFCGISPVKSTIIAIVKKSTDSQRIKWLSKVYNLGLGLK
ncbi:NAD(P)H-dependent oxidoreductase [Solitalea canadensis]|uniref:Putative NADPH-quinone reductase (Modulator of drug activity B) n=1 Tax=Solitalea canadensis (strain ATCC 29591 / DSM 3403 / JCM 21819 / LMG 8368 / NBRC 15130 / NCIMB 12057 / USAM 9D) TaxID=929556 RepID=H8KLL4_SOLCM|nr:NAD(P)H-dependent oxidoreductase [Solitalea canadensis]AFD08901.1 putative NADPH-quinone reductase (modulator of drug activity B) [Solitalea canadensis DSM 3403]